MTTKAIHTYKTLRQRVKTRDTQKESSFSSSCNVHHFKQLTIIQIFKPDMKQKLKCFTLVLGVCTAFLAHSPCSVVSPSSCILATITTKWLAKLLVKIINNAMKSIFRA